MLMSRKLVLALVVVGLWLVSQAAHAADPDFDESHDFLHVVIDGKHYRLDSLVVKATGAKGPLPIALITGGTGRSPAEIRRETVENYAPRARDLALRGWLAVVVIRRGIGQSDGSLAKDRCGRLHVERDLGQATDDLQAAINVVKKRPDVDPSRIIAIGASTGGASVVALGARNPPGLVGVVSFSGGMRFNCTGWDDKRVEAYRKYGAISRVPNLWLYAKNDSLFGPDLVERLHAAFAAGGDDVTLTEFSPFKKEGHFLFTEAAMPWLGELDTFLRHHDLPTWNSLDVSTLLDRLGLDNSQMRFIAAYMTAPAPKAMAFSASTTHAYFQYDGKSGLAANRATAISLCEKAKNTDCGIVMENDRWVWPATQ